MVEAAKKIASMWMEMAQLLRFELYNILTVKINFVDSYFTINFVGSSM